MRFGQSNRSCHVSTTAQNVSLSVVIRSQIYACLLSIARALNTLTLTGAGSSVLRIRINGDGAFATEACSAIRVFICLLRSRVDIVGIRRCVKAALPVNLSLTSFDSSYIIQQGPDVVSLSGRTDRLSIDDITIAGHGGCRLSLWNRHVQSCETNGGTQTIFCSQVADNIGYCSQDICHNFQTRTV